MIIENTTQLSTPEAVLKNWMRAVNDGDLEGLLGLYNDKAILIPTFSNRLLSRPEGIRDYFERLCAREELSIALHEKTLTTQAVADGVFAAHGIYCWRFAVDGELLSFEARFSYAIDLGEQKPIMMHHSSQIPRVI